MPHKLSKNSFKLLCEEPPTFTDSIAKSLYFFTFLLISFPFSPSPIKTSKHLFNSSLFTIPPSSSSTLALTPVPQTSSTILMFIV
uniref:Putative ovule protein n=1 Tax=Solanum chacoense TaxID=4108 RepID=A0A0V0GKL6_SOLCH